jgi:hypothetical protein
MLYNEGRSMLYDEGRSMLYDEGRSMLYSQRPRQGNTYGINASSTFIRSYIISSDLSCPKTSKLQKQSDVATGAEESNISTSDEESDVQNRKTWDWEATRIRIENYEPSPPPTPKRKKLTKEEQGQLNMELYSTPTRKCIQELRI